jgi:hypothetical protein
VPETASDLSAVPDAIHLSTHLIIGVIGKRYPEVTCPLIDHIELAIEEGHELTHVTVLVDGERERAEVDYTLHDPERLMSFLRDHVGRQIYTSIQKGDRLVTNSLFLPRLVDC